MKRMFVGLALFLFFSNASLAQQTAPKSDKSKALSQIAAILIMEAPGLKTSDEAIAYAVVARDLATESGNTAMVSKIEQVLLLYRSISMLQMAGIAQQNGQTEAVQHIKALACKMTSEVSAELGHLPHLVAMKRRCVSI